MIFFPLVLLFVVHFSFQFESIGLIKEYYHDGECTQKDPTYVEFYESDKCINMYGPGSFKIKCVGGAYVETFCEDHKCKKKCIDMLPVDFGCNNNGTNFFCDVKPKINEYGYYHEYHQQYNCDDDAVFSQYYKDGSSCDESAGEKLICDNGKLSFGFFENKDCSGKLKKSYPYTGNYCSNGIYSWLYRCET